MIFDNPIITSFKNLSESDTKTLQEEFIMGECWLLAITLNIMYGFPIQANIQDGDLEHAWVKLPCGKILDIDGISTEGGLWLTPTHSEMDAKSFREVLRNGEPVLTEFEESMKEDPEIPALTVGDRSQFQRCKQMVLEYLLPEYNFTDLKPSY